MFMAQEWSVDMLCTACYVTKGGLAYLMTCRDPLHSCKILTSTDIPPTFGDLAKTSVERVPRLLPSYQTLFPRTLTMKRLTLLKGPSASYPSKCSNITINNMLKTIKQKRRSVPFEFGQRTPTDLTQAQPQHPSKRVLRNVNGCYGPQDGREKRDPNDLL
jgi:hypothetical protein